jgi:hypothetical protein
MNEIVTAEAKTVEEILPAKKPRYEAWSFVHLTKKERKGKSYEELQEMRQARQGGVAESS